MKSFKKILFLIAGLSVATIIILLSIPSLVDLNQHKTEIEQMLEKQANIHAKLNGNIRLSLFPWIGISLNDIDILDPDIFGDTPLLHARRIQINARLMALLKRELKMKITTLDGVAIKLVALKDGQTNLDHILNTSTSPSGDANQKKHTANAAADSGQPLAALTLGGINILNATLLYKDATDGTDLKITKLNLESGAIALGQPANIHSSGHFQSRDTQTSGDIAINGTLNVSENMANIHLKNMTVDSTVHNAGLSAPLTTKITSDIKVNLDTQQMRSTSTINLDAITLRITASGQHILGAPNVSGKIAINEFNARTLAKKYAEQLNTADPHVLEKVSLSSDFKATAEQLKLKNIHISLDQTNLQGTASIAFATPHYDFNLKANSINVDRYLPPVNEAESAGSAAPVAAPAAVALLPVESLRALSLQGQFTLQAMTASGLELKNIAIYSTANHGIIKIAPLTAELYGGTIRSSTTINAQDKEPVVTINNQIQNVHAGPLSTTFTGKKLITGTASVNTTLIAHGNSEQAIQKSLQGDTHLNFSNGAIQGVNIAETIRRAKAKLKGSPLPADASPQKTDFTELSGDIHIQNMRITNNNLSMKSPYLRITGHGSINLSKEDINYLTDVTLTGTPKGQGGKDLQDLVGITIPVRIGGTFDKPSYYPDLKRAIKHKAAKKIKKRIQNEIRKKIGIDLKGLF